MSQVPMASHEVDAGLIGRMGQLGLAGTLVMGDKVQGVD